MDNGSGVPVNTINYKLYPPVLNGINTASGRPVILENPSSQKVDPKDSG